MKKQPLLDKLFEPYKACQLCPLSDLGRAQVVFGSGNPNATLMLIGEAPGKQEDMQGMPFVGRSGKLLTKALDALCINRDDLYITNIVKCRPPNNRAPLLGEVSICKKILLDNQISIIQPKVICALGTYAFNALFPNNTQGITKLRGNFFNFQDIQLMPTFHPSYILRKPKEFKTLVLDLELAYKTSILIQKQSSNL